MSEPWFDANHWAWLPGTLLGCLIGLWGSLAGVLVPQRKGRQVVFGLGFLIAGLAAAFVGAGLIALATGQPYEVWFYLVVPALPVAILALVALSYLPRAYRSAEEKHASTGITQ